MLEIGPAAYRQQLAGAERDARVRDPSGSGFIRTLFGIGIRSVG
jgi:hypothetical protein